MCSRVQHCNFEVAVFHDSLHDVCKMMKSEMTLVLFGVYVFVNVYKSLINTFSYKNNHINADMTLHFSLRTSRGEHKTSYDDR